MGLRVGVDQVSGKLEVTRSGQAEAAMKKGGERKSPRGIQQGDNLDEEAVDRGRLRLERLAEDFM